MEGAEELMSEYLNFEVFGPPVTQGSVKAFVAGGRAHITSKTPPLVEWRETVRLAAIRAMDAAGGFGPQDGPAKVWLAFFLPRPKSAPKTRDIYPSHGRTDLDKYDRAILDAITNAGVWTDDTRVIDLHSRKRYAVGPELHRIYNPAVHRAVPGVEVKILWPDD